MGKLQPREAIAQRRLRQPRERDARARAQVRLVRARHVRHALAHLHNDAVDRPVGNEQVRAVADDERLRAALAHDAADGRRLLRGRGAHERARRPADAKRAVRAHRFVFQNLQARQLRTQRPDNGVQICHKLLSFPGQNPMPRSMLRSCSTASSCAAL